MQSFVWFVSACGIWTGAVLWALENEPEQIMVWCTGWKIEGPYLAANSPKKKKKEKRTHGFMSVWKEAEYSPPPRLHHNFNIHVPIFTSTQTPPLPLFNFTKLPSQPLCRPASHQEQTLCPDKVITTSLEKQIIEVLPCSQLGRNKNFPNWKCSASVIGSRWMQRGGVGERSW